MTLDCGHVVETSDEDNIKPASENMRTWTRTAATVT